DLDQKDLAALDDLLDLVLTARRAAALFVHFLESVFRTYRNDFIGAIAIVVAVVVVAVITRLVILLVLVVRRSRLIRGSFRFYWRSIDAWIFVGLSGFGFYCFGCSFR